MCCLWVSQTISEYSNDWSNKRDVCCPSAFLRSEAEISSEKSKDWGWPSGSLSSQSQLIYEEKCSSGDQQAISAFLEIAIGDVVRTNCFQNVETLKPFSDWLGFVWNPIWRNQTTTKWYDKSSKVMTSIVHMTLYLSKFHEFVISGKVCVFVVNKQVSEWDVLDVVAVVVLLQTSSWRIVILILIKIVASQPFNHV